MIRRSVRILSTLSLQILAVMRSKIYMRVIPLKSRKQDRGTFCLAYSLQLNISRVARELYFIAY
jgi:hypothetical protein